jgi:hypothetical protein
MWSEPSRWDSWHHWELVEPGGRGPSLIIAGASSQEDLAPSSSSHADLGGHKHAMRHNPERMRQMTQAAWLISARPAPGETRTQAATSWSRRD